MNRLSPSTAVATSFGTDFLAGLRAPVLIPSIARLLRHGGKRIGPYTGRTGRSRGHSADGQRFYHHQSNMKITRKIVRRFRVQQMATKQEAYEHLMNPKNKGGFWIQNLDSNVNEYLHQSREVFEEMWETSYGGPIQYGQTQVLVVMLNMLKKFRCLRLAAINAVCAKLMGWWKGNIEHLLNLLEHHYGVIKSHRTYGKNGSCNIRIITLEIEIDDVEKFAKDVNQRFSLALIGSKDKNRKLADLIQDEKAQDRGRAKLTKYWYLKREAARQRAEKIKADEASDYQWVVLPLEELESYPQAPDLLHLIM